MFRLRFALFLICLILRPPALFSQSQAVQEKAGIALIKPQPWAKDNEATVVEFQSFTDRTAGGGGGAGYYELNTKASPKRQVPVSKVVKLVLYADPQQIQEIVTPEERQKLQTTVTEFKDVIARFPATRTYLEPSLKKLEAETAKYDAGQVKTKGTWIARDAYQKEQASHMVNLLRAEIVQAKPAASMDLENDPKYIALKEMAGSSPSVKALLADITELHAKLIRAEKRKEILASLANPSMELAEAEAAMAQLNVLKPEEDPTSAAFVKAWGTASTSAKELSKTGADLAAKLETELAGTQAENAPPELSPELDGQISSLRQKTALFMATKPAAQLIAEARQALAVADAGESFKKLKSLFAEKHYLQAKDVLDNLGRQAAFIGPETERVMSALQRHTAGEIEKFSRLREEAQLLAGSNKPAEALAKYEAAYQVIPNEEVGAEIARLKETAPAP